MEPRPPGATAGQSSTAKHTNNPMTGASGHHIKVAKDRG